MNKCRKTKHKTKRAAHKHLKAMQQAGRGRVNGEGYVYECDKCPYFHITRSKPRNIPKPCDYCGDKRGQCLDCG